MAFGTTLDIGRFTWTLVLISGYRDLKAWKSAHAFRLAVYRVTEQYPVSEGFGLTSQTRCASSSIAANIAEGAGRSSSTEYCRFLTYAIGSANETEDHLLLAKDLGYLATDTWKDLDGDLREVRSTLTGLRQYLRSLRTQ